MNHFGRDNVLPPTGEAVSEPLAPIERCRADLPMAELLISADSHVKMSHEQVKAHLASKHHLAYDQAAGAYEARMRRGTGAANRAGAVQVAASNAVFARPGYWDPVERLKDMDKDGVATEVLYSEV